MPEANFCGTMHHRQDQRNDSSQRTSPVFHAPHSVLRLHVVLLCQHMCVRQDQRHQTDVGSDPLFMRGIEKEVDADENRGGGG